MMGLYSYLVLRMPFKKGNVRKAPELKIRLADDSAETLGGRSTLVIVPNK